MASAEELRQFNCPPVVSPGCRLQVWGYSAWPCRSTPFTGLPVRRDTSRAIGKSVPTGHWTHYQSLLTRLLSLLSWTSYHATWKEEDPADGLSVAFLKRVLMMKMLIMKRAKNPDDFSSGFRPCIVFAESRPEPPGRRYRRTSTLHNSPLQTNHGARLTARFMARSSSSKLAGARAVQREKSAAASLGRNDTNLVHGELARSQQKAKPFQSPGIN
jgi:hypothetical protein